MRVFVIGLIAAIALGVVAAATLSAIQRPSFEVYSSSSTRVGDPGSNLISGGRDVREYQGSGS